MDEKTKKTKQELEDAGWKLASLSGGDHLKRTLEMYQELGFETYLEEVRYEECDTCTVCFSEGNEIAYRIYTRSSGDDTE
jgi:hypothetical protein